MAPNDDKCTLGALNRQAVEGLRLDHNKLVDVVDKIRNRPPLYITVILSILLGAIGFLIRGYNV